MTSIKDMLLNEKPVLVLTSVYNRGCDPFIGQVSNDIDTTYAHTVKIVDNLNEKGLVEREKSGRKKFISLTGKGEEYAELFNDILELADDGAVVGRESLDDIDLTSGSPIAD
jgi:DNA-binding MarR family transcriptional regulator